MDDNDKEYDAQHRQWKIQPGQSTTIELDDIRSLDMHLIRGRVDVIGTDDDGVRLEVALVSGEPLDITCKGHTLDIRHQGTVQIDTFHIFKGFRTLFGTDMHNGIAAEISLFVPRWIEVGISMVRGDTLISGLEHGASLSTVSGTTVSDGLRGDLKLNNVSGKVEARNHHGSIHANTVSGEVILSGEITSVKTSSVSGDLYVDAFGMPERISFNAVSGNMAIRFDPDIHVAYSVTTMNGRAQLGGSRFATHLKGLHYEDGPEGGSSTHIEFNALSGSIKSVRRDRRQEGDRTPLDDDGDRNRENPDDFDHRNDYDDLNKDDVSENGGWQ